MDSDHEGDIEDEAEESLKYLIGYYHPTHIGQIFNQRYEVVHKLGQGGFSTVWLAQDIESGKAVALKIMCSSTKAANEYETHLDIKQRVRDRSRLVLVLDGFVVKRTHDDGELQHQVLVLPLRGPSLMALGATERPFSHRMSAAKHLLQAVLSIHNAGLVHRDIRPQNVVYGLNVDLGKLSTTDKYKLLGRPRKARIIKDDELNRELVAPAKFPPRSLVLRPISATLASSSGQAPRWSTSSSHRRTTAPRSCSTTSSLALRVTCGATWLCSCISTREPRYLSVGVSLAGSALLSDMLGGCPWGGRAAMSFMIKMRSRHRGTARARKEGTQLLSVTSLTCIVLI